MNYRTGIKTLVVLAALGVGVLGCTSLQSVTSGQIGCAEADIVIVSDESGWNSRTWTATCNGKTYFCSAHGGGRNATPQVSCKEKNDSNAAAAPAAAGCQNDSQCKGDRVCKAGSCVDPK